MNRPQLRTGDVVKLSNKGKSYRREFPKNSTLAVSRVDGNGIDRSSVITCRVKVGGIYKLYKFYRSELWKTGANAFEK